MNGRFILFYYFLSTLISNSFASMGRFGGWSNFYKSSGPSSEQVKNASFDEVPENLSVDSKPRALSEQSSKSSGVLYTAEEKYKLPPVNFEKVYSDVDKSNNKKLKVKPVIPINGLNIIETGTYIAN